MPPNKLAEWANWLGFNIRDASGKEDPRLVKMVEVSAQWTVAFRKRQAPRWLTLMGGSGCGKTHLISRLFAHANTNSNTDKTDYMPHVVYWPKFIQDLRGGECFKKRDDMRQWPVLCLDDIGAERDPNGFGTEELNTLLGIRMNRWTLLTSNEGFEYFERVETRIASRIVRPPNLHLTTDAEDFGLR